MTKELIALLDGRKSGSVVRDNRGKLTFIYDEVWRNAADAYPLSDPPAGRSFLAASFGEFAAVIPWRRRNH